MSFLPLYPQLRASLESTALTSIKLSPILSFVTISPVYGVSFPRPRLFSAKVKQGNNQMNENAKIFCCSLPRFISYLSMKEELKM